MVRFKSVLNGDKINHAKDGRSATLRISEKFPGPTNFPHSAELTRLTQRGRSFIADERSASNASTYLDLGILQLRSGNAGTAEQAFRDALALAPECVEAHVNLGILLISAERREEAEVSLRRAIELSPDHVIAHHYLARVMMFSGRFKEAEMLFRRAIALVPDDPVTHCGLATSLMGIGRIRESHRASDHALAIDPRCFDAHMNMALALRQLQRWREAEVSLRNALNIAPGHHIASGLLVNVLLRPERGDARAARVTAAIAVLRDALGRDSRLADLQSDLANLLLLRGEYEEGWRWFEIRKTLMSYGKTVPATTRNEWQGEPLEGRRLVVLCEMGLGDCLQFCRYLPLLKRLGLSQLTVVCPRPLIRLFERIEGVDACLPPMPPHSVPQHDFWIFMMSLPSRFGTTLQTIPPVPCGLHAPEALLEHWSKHLPANGFKVGVVWAGDPRMHDPHSNAIDRRRSLHARDLAPLLNVPGTTFVSLQLGETTRPQIFSIPRQQRPLDPMDDVSDFADTGAIMECLDLIVTVDTSMAHLAGSLNCPVWILSRFDGCWRWLENRDDSPWYPSARLFRQTSPGNWGAVIERVALALRAHIAQHSQGLGRDK